MFLIPEGRLAIQTERKIDKWKGKTTLSLTLTFSPNSSGSKNIDDLDENANPYTFSNISCKISSKNYQVLFSKIRS